MYIVEYLIKFFQNKTVQPREQTPVFEGEEEKLEDISTCSHIFVAIDSTENTYACSKCGYVVSKEELRKMKNFFMK